MSDRDQPPEPEIIPPGAADPTHWQDRRGSRGPGGPGQGRVWMWSSDGRGTRLRYGRPGPLGLVLIFAALAVLGALGFFVFLGALAITLPLIAALVIVGLIGGALRKL
ncbi:MAG TPA: hypothetical protein VNF99_04425 [Stellaceae bacterium]|nr:hypothetical protein [Stellaceae bacterium]